MEKCSKSREQHMHSSGSEAEPLEEIWCGVTLRSGGGERVDRHVAGRVKREQNAVRSRHTHIYHTALYTFYILSPLPFNLGYLRFLQLVDRKPWKSAEYNSSGFRRVEGRRQRLRGADSFRGQMGPLKDGGSEDWGPTQRGGQVQWRQPQPRSSSARLLYWALPQDVELEVLIFLDTEATESSRLGLRGRMAGFLPPWTANASHYCL